ncbi:GntR family transcriptional regulator [Streptomyces europaeiscabiei]|uniref:GntR family transcriptional regulator n=1 Tax=Streptomyces europaeiscabiei TaxID=146819 RepID=UPI0029A59B41|nr:GntR family transcriptional regulator [Streptomyces europaeiscabiei]MDX3841039.1 GntR family transcriptional regulator [Streptomyces europaeiscabiei]
MPVDPDAEIDHEGPVTPYRQLAEILRARIKRGDWTEGRPIPSETRLVQEYGLARSTVRRAIAVLVEDGEAWTVQGRGTYVGQPPGESSEQAPAGT